MAVLVATVMLQAWIDRTQQRLAARQAVLAFPEQALAQQALTQLVRRAVNDQAPSRVRASLRSRTSLAGRHCAPDAVYVWGPTGSGKTTVIAQALRAVRHELSPYAVISATALEWAERLRIAEAEGQLVAIMNQLTTMALVVVEDWDQLAQPPRRDGAAPVPPVPPVAPSTCLVRMLATLEATPVRWIFSATVLPGAIPGLPPRLIGRARSSALASLEPLGEESRRLLWQRALGGQVLADTYRAAIDRGARTPGGILTQAKTLTSLTRLRPKLDEAELEQVFAAPPVTPSLDQILQAVATEFAVSPVELRSSARHQSLVLPRQCAMYLSRELTRTSFDEIGAFLGERAHTTASHGHRKLSDLLPGSPSLREQVSRITERLRQSLWKECG